MTNIDKIIKQAEGIVQELRQIKAMSVTKPVKPKRKVLIAKFKSKI